MLTIGAGFGLMSLSVIIADCVMLHCTKNKSLYQKIKELDLKDDVENEVIQLDQVSEEDENEEDDQVNNNNEKENENQNKIEYGLEACMVKL